MNINACCYNIINMHLGGTLRALRRTKQERQEHSAKHAGNAERRDE